MGSTDMALPFYPPLPRINFYEMTHIAHGRGKKALTAGGEGIDSFHPL
jgi:hypothetical protein